MIRTRPNRFRSSSRPGGKPRLVARAAVSMALLFTFSATAIVDTVAHAAEIEGVTFTESVAVNGTPLQLHAVGLLRYRWIIKGYVVALYLGDDAGPERVFNGDTPRRLELHYFYSIKGKSFGGAAEEILARNVDAATYARLAPDIAKMHAAYRDVAPGDRYALTYVPATGTTLTFNDEPLITIAGAEFANAYFQIWLGKDSINNSLRDQLLTAAAR
jgi:hypothetical protein